MRNAAMRKLLLISVLPVVSLYAASGAGAATITVNSTSDGGPSPNTGNCTLREAIVSANTDTASGSVAGECAAGSGIDTINFDASFNGQLADTITLVADGQEITQRVTVNGGDCDATSAARPCVGINAGGEIAFFVTADNVTIQGFAITNAADGVNAAAIGGGAGGDNLVVHNSWFGLKVDGTPGPAPPLGSTGVIYAHNGATIGGTSPADRNVFAQNATGVRLASGDATRILGNYFGTEADGDANAALGNAISNVTVTSIPGFGTALDNVIGGPEKGVPATCDGACNLLAPTTGPVNLALTGDAGPSGGSTVQGNFIGVGLAGGQQGTGASEIALGGADDTTIGGPSAADRNYIGLGSVTTSAGALNAVIQNNFVGLNQAGTARIGTGGTIALTDTTGANVAGNRVAQDLNNAPGISTSGPANTIRGNVVGIGTGDQDVGSGTAAITVFGEGADANLIGGPNPGDGNTLGNGKVGVNIVDGDANIVQGNFIGTDAGEAADYGYAGLGIDVGHISGNSATGNILGGNAAGSENVISNIAAIGQLGDAIRIVANGEDGNQILRNRGIDNGGLFVDLGANGFGNGPNGPNNDIAAPTITAGATSALVSGTGAAPGATVRVYRTDSTAGTDPNNLKAFAGQAVADGSGNWALTCPSAGCTVGLPGAGQLTANQTDTNGNSSEFSKAASFADLPPDTSITSGPANGGATNDSTPTFGFASSEPNSTFQCKVDGGSFVSCNNPHTTTVLGEGSHTIEVEAIDSTAQIDGTPASRTFTVDLTAPDTQIDSGPADGSAIADPTPSFGFSANDAGAGFECRVDGEAFAACTPEHTTAALADGQHTIEVRASDAVGNADGTPASRTFSVDTTPPDTLIDSGPDAGSTTADSTPSFGFSATEAGSSFECRLDSQAFAACTSEHTTAALADGEHTFEVRATDALGNADASPAGRTFTVDAIPDTVPDNDPPQTKIDQAPKDKLKVRKTATVSYRFSSDEAGSTFRCEFDGKALAQCSSPLRISKVGRGKHTFAVTAVDAAGNPDPTPATDSFKVKRKRKRRR